MKLTEELKKEIDNMDYETMLTKWRFTTGANNPIFEDESGRYFADSMFEKRDKLSAGEAAQVSKRIGWDSK